MFHRCWSPWPGGGRFWWRWPRVVFGLVPEDGSLLWSQSWDTDMGINVSQPIIVDKNRFFLSSGYGKGAALVEVTGSGKSFRGEALSGKTST